MWRFIIATFAFLGWSFYVLSGGADYQPRTQSLQARAKLDDVRPLARPVQVDVAVLDADTTPVDTAVDVAPSDADEVTRALSTLDDLNLTGDGRLEVTLAAIEVTDAAQPVFETDPQKTETLVETPDISAEDAGADTVAADLPPLDIRRVTGTVVNMRDGPSTYYLAIGKLTKDTEVEVIGASDDGWLNIRVLDTQQEGWMADWLVSAAAN